MAALLPYHFSVTEAHEPDTFEITVVADQRHWPDLDPRLADVAASATETAPSVRPNIRMLSTQQWAEKTGWRNARRTPQHLVVVRRRFTAFRFRSSGRVKSRWRTTTLAAHTHRELANSTPTPTPDDTIRHAGKVK